MTNTSEVYIGRKAPLSDEVVEARLNLCRTVVTLNGERATISGTRRPFASVRQVSSGLGCEFAWETVARIVAGSKKFSS